MAEAKDRAAWNRTFAMLAGLYNPNRAKGAKPIDPMQFFPWADLKSKPLAGPTEAERQVLREAFPKKD